MVPTITNSGGLRWLAMGCVLVLGGARALGQYQPPPPPLTTAPCVPTKKDPCAIPPVAKIPVQAVPPVAEQFPFPGDDPGFAKPAADVAKPAATPAGAGASTADKFPFPGEAEAPAAAPSSSSSSSSGSSSSSDSSSSSSSSSGSYSDDSPDHEQPPLKDMGSSGLTRTQRRHLPKVEDMDHREEEDLQVAHFYFTTGDFQASYLRAADAVKIMADDAAAHFALAQAAQRLKKNDEAVAEYGTYLKLAPDGEKAKAALKALNQLVSK